MKRTLPAIAGTLLIAFLFASCGWFNRKPAVPEPGLTGNWRFDSTVHKNDTTADGMSALLMALAPGDGTPVTYTFSSDSIVVKGGKGRMEAAAYAFDGQRITLRDSAKTVLGVTRLTDSVLLLTGADSARFYFTRQ